MLKEVKGMVNECPEEMPSDHECDKDKANSFEEDDSWF